MRKIQVVTTSRADYGIYRSILQHLEASSEFELELIVGGTHLLAQFGHTIDAINADGYKIVAEINALMAGDNPQSISQSVSVGIASFAQHFHHNPPDLLIVLGDRYEMYSAVVAALPFRIPVAHIHGGEVTFGAIDDALRHSMTKLSHLHFVSTEAYAQRVIQLGENPDRVVVCGAPALDNIHTIERMSKAELESQFPISLEGEPLLVTFHPVTLEIENALHQVTELLSALETVGNTVIFTLPNADTANQVIRRAIVDYVDNHDKTYAVESFGIKGYFSAMTHASAMVGNSSSGILEAGAFGLPVVNIGNRQEGRLQGANVINSDYDSQSIISAIQTATSAEFKAGMSNKSHPYQRNELAGDIIVKTLEAIDDFAPLTIKRFYDL